MVARLLNTIAFALIAGLILAPASAQTSPPEPQQTGATAQASVATSATATATVAAPPSSSESSGGYYVEFRVAEIGAYGHTYAVYGPNGGRANFADLHPMGGYAVMALGHLVPVPANTQWNPEVARLPVASRYRRSLNAAQYQRLLAAVRSARAKGGYWNAVTNNCNHFIAQLALAVGMRVPEQFQLSYGFVPAMRELNEGRRSTEPARGRKPARSANTSPPT